MTDRLTGESPVDWFPDPFPIDESRLERRDHTKYPIPPPESIDPRSIAIQPRSFGRARARARAQIGRRAR